MNRLRKFWVYGFLIVLSGTPLPDSAIELPDIGASADDVVSPALEKKVGESVMRTLRYQMELIDDLEIENYFNALGKKLVSYSDAPMQEFHFFVVKSDVVNAFAMPGGFIGTHSGLILNTQSESELASVLAHEIAHITQRHLARTFEAVNRLSIPSAVAALVAVIASAALNNPDIGQAAVAAISAGNQQLQVNFTRLHEKEADRIGMQLLAAGGFDPLSMPNFFESLQANTRYYGQGVPEFLRTHPVTTDRIAEARERAKQFPRKNFEESPSYQLMRARLLVLIEENPAQLAKKLQNMLSAGRYRNELATRYALVLAKLASEQTEGVSAQIEWLFQHDGDKEVYRLQQAHLALLQKHVDEAMQLYDQALRVYPNDPLLSLDYAEKLLQNSHPARAKTVLLALSSLANSRYYRLLAQTYQALGNTAEMHLALAEDFYLNGQTALALSQLKQARQQKKLDFYVAARLEARYRELQHALQEEQDSSGAPEP